MGDDSGGLEHAVTTDDNFTDTDISSKVMLTAVLTFVKDSDIVADRTKALPVASNYASDDYGLNLGLSLIKQEFAGFTGIALITTPYVKSTLPILNKGKINGKADKLKDAKDSVVTIPTQKNFYSCIKIPREYISQDFISRKKLSEIQASDIVSFKHYCFDPSAEESCKNIHTALEDDLVTSKFCDRQMASTYVVGVADALRTHKPLLEWSKRSAKIYVLCVDSKPTIDAFNNGKDNEVSPPTNAKNIYLLRCWTHNTSHLNL